MNNSQTDGLFYSPGVRTSIEIGADITDKTPVEVFVDKDAFYNAMERKTLPGNCEGFKFFGRYLEVAGIRGCSISSIRVK